MKKKGLGRGLSALFGDEQKQSKSQETNKPNIISISDLSRNQYQPRQNFKEEKLEELANSIRKNGMLKPIPYCRDMPLQSASLIPVGCHIM